MPVRTTSIIVWFLVAAFAIGCGDNLHPPVTPPDPAAADKDITRFTILGVDASITGTSIALTLPFGTSPASLTPAVVITGVTVSPASDAAQDFTNPVAYTVTAEDGSTKTYTAAVNIASSSAKDITQFTILGVDGAISGTNIALQVPFGTALTSLTPTIAITGTSVSPASGAAQDFTNPVAYTVSAADGSTKTYTATVTAAQSSAKDITQFTILGLAGTITGTSIALQVPVGTALTSLTPTIAITGTSVSPASGVAQDFTNPVAYTVTAADGSTKAYTATVTIALTGAKDITRFTILGVDGAITGTSIALTLPAGTSLTALTPTVVITGVSVSPASGVAHDFSSPATYTVTASNGSTKAYSVVVSVAAAGAKDITKFAILGVDGAIAGTSIALTLPFGTSLASLTPTIAITGTSVSPASGVAQDFTNPVAYTVTAADGSTKTYTATVTVAVASAKDITRFTILGVDGAITGTAISLTLPFGTDLTSLTPTIVITGVGVSPASGVAQDFTGPVVYTVAASDGSTKSYTVTVSIAQSAAKDIIQFTILGVDGAITSNTISLTLPFGTSLTNLTPAIAITGNHVSPASGVAQDFTGPVSYTVTANDGSTKTYTVTVTVAANSAKDITQFTILGSDGAIGSTTISLTLPFGTSLASLTPTIAITGTSVSPASGVARDFTSPVTYTVTAADGSTKAYVVTVTVAANSAKDITQFTILGVDGAIGPNSITLTLPFGTSLTSLTPAIAITGTSVSPASGVAHDFTNPVTYTVTAADGTTKAYLVTASVAQDSAKDITQFTILGIAGAIGANSITLTLPFGTSLTSLAPAIAIDGTSVSPASGAAQDFTSPVTYTVTAADGSTKAYVVTVNVAQDSAKDITQFTILGVNGTISGTAIVLVLPFGTALTSLTPTIAITGTGVSPASGVARDFTNPVMYTVTAADGSTQVYTVTVTSALSGSKDILAFSILGVDGLVNGTTITLTLPYGTDLTSLAPTIAITGISVSPGSGVPQDFTNAVTYTVKAQDNTTKAYTVTVSLADGSAKDIIRFTVLGLDAVIATTSPTTGTITLNVPKGSNLAALTPTVTITGVSVSPKSGVAEDFTGPVQYVVTAADGSTKTYTVTIGTVNGLGTKLITDFIILGVHAQITNGINSATIMLTLPHGTNPNGQAPTIITNCASVSPPSFIPQDFANPVLYTATAADGSTRVYTVTVTIAP